MVRSAVPTGLYRGLARSTWVKVKPGRSPRCRSAQSTRCFWMSTPWYWSMRPIFSTMPTASRPAPQPQSSRREEVERPILSSRRPTSATAEDTNASSWRKWAPPIRYTVGGSFTPAGDVPWWVRGSTAAWARPTMDFSTRASLGESAAPGRSGAQDGRGGPVQGVAPVRERRQTGGVPHVVRQHAVRGPGRGQGEVVGRDRRDPLRVEPELLEHGP